VSEKTPKLSMSTPAGGENDLITKKQSALLNAGRALMDKSLNECATLGLAVLLTMACPNEEENSSPEILTRHATVTYANGSRDGIICGLLNALKDIVPLHQRVIFELMKIDPDFAEMRAFKGEEVSATIVPEVLPKSQVN